MRTFREVYNSEFELVQLVQRAPRKPVRGWDVLIFHGGPSLILTIETDIIAERLVL